MSGLISTRIARAVGRFVQSRPQRIEWPGGVVSFTFDDFPKSALLTGGAVLEKHGARGTYYAALGIAGTDSELGPICDLDGIREGHARGHELACHTHSHLDCSRASTSTILADIAKNKAAFEELLGGYAPVSFAFPFGAMSLGAKRAVAGRFTSCRGIEWGTNSGTADLAGLASTRLYSDDFDSGILCGLIDRNRALGGWLIFYTHDVDAVPSPYGCTPDQLATIVAHAAANSEILPVRDVVGRLATTQD